MQNRNIKIIISMIIVICITSSCFRALALADNTSTNNKIRSVHYIEQEENKKELSSNAITYEECFYVELYSVDDTTKCIEYIDYKINTINSAIDSYAYTEEAISTMQDELCRLIDLKAIYETDLAKYAKWESEYYYAAKVWEFLKQDGYSDAAACGIIGNMMVETSGGSLNLKPNAYSSTGKYYGLCQWNKGYGIHGSSFEHQLNFLNSNIEREFRVFGSNYKTGFNFEDFISMSDPAQAAIAFAEVYERCYSNSFGLRKQAAQQAYNYFINSTF